MTSLLSKEELKQIWVEVKENNRKWRECKKHFFPPKADGKYTMTTKVTCSNCGAWTEPGNAADYARGYVAAGGNIEEVFPDMKEKQGESKART